MTNMQIAEYLCSVINKYNLDPSEDKVLTSGLVEDKNGCISTYRLILTDSVTLYRAWIANPDLAYTYLASSSAHPIIACWAKDLLENGGPHDTN